MMTICLQFLPRLLVSFFSSKATFQFICDQHEISSDSHYFVKEADDYNMENNEQWKPF